MFQVVDTGTVKWALSMFSPDRLLEEDEMNKESSCKHWVADPPCLLLFVGTPCRNQQGCTKSTGRTLKEKCMANTYVVLSPSFGKESVNVVSVTCLSKTEGRQMCPVWWLSITDDSWDPLKNYLIIYSGYRLQIKQTVSIFKVEWPELKFPGVILVETGIVSHYQQKKGSRLL